AGKNRPRGGPGGQKRKTALANPREAPCPAAPRRRVARRAPRPAKSAGSGGGPSFDDLVRPRQQRGRDGEVESSGGLQIDNRLDLRGLQDGHLGWLGTLQDASRVEAGFAVGI